MIWECNTNIPCTLKDYADRHDDQEIYTNVLEKAKAQLKVNDIDDCLILNFVIENKVVNHLVCLLDANELTNL